jgi:hypothetical protein
MELKDWLGPIISGIAALLSVIFSIVTRFEVRRQQRLQAFGLRRQYDADLRAWANSTLEALGEALTLTFLPADAIDAKDYAIRREDILTRLSTAADAGRWFFPNEDPDAHGHWKPTAYRGFRPAILDCVVGAFNEVRELTPGNSSAKTKSVLLEHRRQFVSYVQVRLDPRTRDDELNKLFG